MQVNRLGEGFGAEIDGVDLSGDVSDAAFAQILDALLEHQVVVIRGQDLSPKAQKAFSRRLGDLQLHISSKHKMEDHPEVLILSNRKVDGEWVGATNAGDEWHSDLHYMPVPTKYTLLHALEVPEEGGETAFLNIYAAYDALDAATKEKLSDLRSVNSWNRLRNPRVKVPQQHGDGKAVYETGHPDAIHPVIRTHPETGRKALYVSPRHTLGIEGMETEESEPLLQDLFAVQQRPEHVYTHKYRLGDLIIWDNRCLLHKACGGIKPPGIRHMHRTVVEGSVPV
jgi:taurine dioxygenase